MVQRQPPANAHIHDFQWGFFITFTDSIFQFVWAVYFCVNFFRSFAICYRFFSYVFARFHNFLSLPSPMLVLLLLLLQYFAVLFFHFAVRRRPHKCLLNFRYVYLKLQISICRKWHMGKWWHWKSVSDSPFSLRIFYCDFPHRCAFV